MLFTMIPSSDDQSTLKLSSEETNDPDKTMVKKTNSIHQEAISFSILPVSLKNNYSQIAQIVRHI